MSWKLLLPHITPILIMVLCHESDELGTEDPSDFVLARFLLSITSP